MMWDNVVCGLRTTIQFKSVRAQACKREKRKNNSNTCLVQSSLTYGRLRQRAPPLLLLLYHHC